MQYFRIFAGGVFSKYNLKLKTTKAATSPRIVYTGIICKPKINPAKDRKNIVKTPLSKEKAMFKNILSIGLIIA